MEVIIKGKALQAVTWHDEYVMTTEQVAYFFVVAPKNVTDNFANNRDRYVEGKHYFKVEGNDLKKLRTEIFGLQISPMTRSLILWTKRGVARHAKSINSDVAWDIFEMLEDNYFNRQVPAVVANNKEPGAPFWWELAKVSPPPRKTTNFQRGVELKKLASHTRDPETREWLIMQAAKFLISDDR